MTWRGQVPCHPFEAARCVYVEVPKAGCTSVKTALSPFKGGPPEDGEDIHGWTGYTHARSVRHLYDWLETRWSDLFRFTVVREPTERFVSFYYGLEPYERGCYGDVNRYVCSGEFERDLEWRSNIHVIPQTLLIGTELERFDFVGRTETMDVELWREFRDRLGLDVDVPHLNRSSADRDELSDETRERLRVIYWRDYEVLGYD